jgi:hypothetical protein
MTKENLSDWATEMDPLNVNYKLNFWLGLGDDDPRIC